MRTAISQALTHDPEQCAIRPRHIIYAQLHPIVVPEIELRHVAVQVPLGAMLVDTLHAALEHGVEAFDRIGVDRRIDTGHILVSAVVAVPWAAKRRP